MINPVRPAGSEPKETTQVYELGYFFQIQANSLQEAFTAGAEFLATKDWNEVTKAPYAFLEYYPEEEDQICFG